MKNSIRAARALASRSVALVSIAVLSTGATAALAPTSVSAASGVSIDLGRVTIGEPLAGGARYDLPLFTVSNPGDQTASYVISVGGVEDDEGTVPDAGWFTFTPSEFSLEAGQSQTVQARLDLPAGAAAGRYAGLVRAQLASDGEGALVGAAAAGLLRFEVAPPDGDSGGTSGATASLPAWGGGIALALVVVVVSAWAFARRYRISIGRR